MSDNNSPKNSQLTPDQQDKLRELTTQSWNLELAISGVAMFAILQVPDLLESAFSYIRYNYMTHTEGAAVMLPSMVYSLIRAMCHILFIAFLANFVMRAFWVGLVGLLAVFPSGIQYDRVPFSTPYAQQRMADELGPLDSYILWLDKRCNIVFALAFQFVFLLVIVALLYLLLMLVYLVVQPNVSAGVWFGVKVVLGILTAVFLLASMLLAQKKIKETPRGTQLNYQLTKVGRLMMLGVYKHSSYVSNTFYTNIRPSKLIQATAIFIVVFFGMFFLEYANDISRTSGRVSLFNSRHLYSARVDSLYVEPTAYDNQRPEGTFVSTASIQSDVIREPFLRLFIAYPKSARYETQATRPQTRLERYAVEASTSAAVCYLEQPAD